jgi:hypothetical protein
VRISYLRISPYLIELSRNGDAVRNFCFWKGGLKPMILSEKKLGSVVRRGVYFRPTEGRKINSGWFIDPT